MVELYPSLPRLVEEDGAGRTSIASKQFLTVTEPARLTLEAGVLRIRSWMGMAFEVQASADLTSGRHGPP